MPGRGGPPMYGGMPGPGPPMNGRGGPPMKGGGIMPPRGGPPIIIGGPPMKPPGGGIPPRERWKSAICCSITSWPSPDPSNCKKYDFTFDLCL